MKQFENIHEEKLHSFILFYAIYIEWTILRFFFFLNFKSILFYVLFFDIIPII